MKIAFAADPIENFDPKAETTSFVAYEAQQRGGTCLFFELRHLCLIDNKPHAICKTVKIKRQKKLFVYKTTKEALVDLTKIDVVFLRKDPPIDQIFLDHLSILEFLLGHTLVINHPTSVKRFGDKWMPLRYPQHIPPTLISKDIGLIKDFIQRHKTVILKPIDLSGGREILKVTSQMSAITSVIDLMIKNGARYVMAQKFIPEAKKGDKRILLLDGEVIGSFLRIPPKEDFRGNLHSGAKLARTKLTVNDKKIVDDIREDLKNKGLPFVGIDILGRYITEINTTSPMGIREINEMEKTKIEREIVDWIEGAIKSYRAVS